MNIDTIIGMIVIVLIIILAYLDGQLSGSRNQMLLMNPIIIVIIMITSIVVGWFSILLGILLFYINYKIYKYRKLKR